MIAEYDELARSPAHEVALECIEAGIDAARPERVVRTALTLDGDRLSVGDAAYDLGAYDELLVLGGGKASARLAGALVDLLGDRIDGGAVVAPGGTADSRDDRADTACGNDDGRGPVEVLVGSHPVPDEDSVVGAKRVLELARGAGERTLVLAPITGGGSALLAAPTDDIALGDLQNVTAGLLESGATIHEVNAVRKHCSAIKGGQLARAAAPATVVGLVMSDVVGDDLGVIASGPTAPDPTTYRDALAVLERYDIEAPDSVIAHLERGVAGEISETPKPGDPVFDAVHNHVIANAHTALDAARGVADDRGYETLLLSTRIRGEARESALAHVAVAEEMLDTGNPLEPPAVVLSGGETTVTVRGDGRGGPNQEFALGGALELPDDVVLAAVDTDGEDGSTDAAGALVDGSTIGERSADGSPPPGEAGTDEGGRDALAANDAYTFLDARGALVRTGPTGTNVNDLRVLVVGDCTGRQNAR